MSSVIDSHFVAVHNWCLKYFSDLNMPRIKPPTISRHAKDAVTLLSGEIRAARIEKRMTAAELAERAGVSRGLVARVERGDLACSIGTVFDIAVIAGVDLFDQGSDRRSAHLASTRKILELLPKRARALQPPKVDDDF
jgi:transcriptional regulator with XRE-family HTH domain